MIWAGLRIDVRRHPARVRYEVQRVSGARERIFPDRKFGQPNGAYTHRLSIFTWLQPCSWCGADIALKPNGCREGHDVPREREARCRCSKMAPHGHGGVCCGSHRPLECAPNRAPDAGGPMAGRIPSVS